MPLMRPYRTTRARALYQAEQSGFLARSLDADDLALIEHIRHTGRLDADMLTAADTVKADYVDHSAPSYADETAELEAFAQSRAVATVGRAPLYHEIVTTNPPSNGYAVRAHQLQLREYNRQFARWEKQCKQAIRTMTPACAEAVLERHLELASLEAANRSASLERIELARAQEAERAKTRRQQQVAKARAELQYQEDQRLTATELKQQWRVWNKQRQETLERQRTIAVQRQRDDAEWESAEKKQRLSALAAERRTLGEAETAIKTTTRIARTIARKIKSHEQQHHHQEHRGHSRENPQNLETGR